TDRVRECGQKENRQELNALSRTDFPKPVVPTRLPLDVRQLPPVPDAYLSHWSYRPIDGASLPPARFGDVKRGRMRGKDRSENWPCVRRISVASWAMPRRKKTASALVPRLVT